MTLPLSYDEYGLPARSGTSRCSPNTRGTRPFARKVFFEPRIEAAGEGKSIWENFSAIRAASRI